MKRFRVAALLLVLILLAGCGGGRPHEIAPGQLTDQELAYLQALTEDLQVFTLGAGEYEVALYCYAQGEWQDAGSAGPVDGGGNMLFATQLYPASARRLPDTWVCSADGITFTGYMPWQDTADANAKLYSHLAAPVQMEPGVEYAVAAAYFADGEMAGSLSIDVGGAFDINAVDLTGHSYAWVFTVTLA